MVFDNEGQDLYKIITEALFDNYESIYDINVSTKAYRIYHQSDFYRELKLSRSGKDFFAVLENSIKRIIAPEDQDYVLKMLQKDALLEGVLNKKYYTIVYRIQQEEIKIYHQLRATVRTVGNNLHILMGVKNVDDVFTQEIRHIQEMDSLRQRSNTQLEAILATASSYLEANLTKNLVLDISVGNQKDKKREIQEIFQRGELSSYDDINRWISSNLIVSNHTKYDEISDRNFLLKRFQLGEKRTSASFDVYSVNDLIQPCREVFYLYQNRTTQDIHAICVVYDLTEQQKQEREIKMLEEKLRMSRIRNFTSQMQPHFLYNTLGSIQEIILMDPDYASELLEDFTIYLRGCVRAMSNDEPVLFSQELENIKAYVSIEKMRFGDKLSVEYKVEADTFPILPLSVQPLVENAIRHGIYEKGKEGGKVTVQTREEQNEWIVLVEDNGVGFDVNSYLENMRNPDRDATGLKNLMFRLNKVLQASVELKSKPEEGTTVMIRIPKP